VVVGCRARLVGGFGGGRRWVASAVGSGRVAAAHGDRPLGSVPLHSGEVDEHVLQLGANSLHVFHRDARLTKRVHEVVQAVTRGGDLDGGRAAPVALARAETRLDPSHVEPLRRVATTASSMSALTTRIPSRSVPERRAVTVSSATI